VNAFSAALDTSALAAPPANRFDDNARLPRPKPLRDDPLMPPSRAAARSATPSALEGAPPRTQLRLLGDPAVVLPAGLRALERRAAALLALVSLEPGVTRARAAGLLWPESENPRRALRQQLSRFKASYGVELVVGEEVLHLAPGIDADLAQPAAGGPLAGALLGDLRFDDCEEFDALLTQHRTQRQRLATQEIGRSLADAEAEGDLEAATQLAEQLVLADSQSEAHARTLMRLHYLRGDVSLAQAAYERLSDKLARDCGARPSAETEALARAVRNALSAPAVAALPARTAPAAVLRPPRLVGRGRELASLRTAWQAGRVGLLLGEPGLGKSRLLGEIASQARDAIVVQGRPGDAGVPYATLARLLRVVIERSPQLLEPGGERSTAGVPRHELARLLPELAPGIPRPAEGQRIVLQAAVEQLLAQSRLAGLFIDDLHFADEASCEMLQALIASDVGPQLHWALAQRPGEGTAAAARLRDALEEASLLETVALAPLTEDEVAELIDSLGLPELDGRALAPVLLRHTGGNPLYALETLKQALTRGVALDARRLPQPASVGTLIERRLKQLSERALSLARVAAVAGVDFSIPMAEDVMGVRAVELANAWTELEAAQVLRENAFAHDLVFDAVLRSVPAPIARHLHAAVAAFLERHDGAPARVAGHWLTAGQRRPAVPSLHRAATQARAGLRRREELGFLMTAAGIEEEEGELDAAWSTLQAASEAQICIDTVPLAALEAARDRLARTPAQQADLAMDRSTFLLNLGRFAEAEEEAHRAVTAARASGSAQHLAGALSSLASSLAMQGQSQDALLPSDEMMALLEHVDTPSGKLYSERGILLDNLGRPRDATPVHRLAVQLELQRGDRSAAVSALTNLACSQMDAGRLRAALATLDQAQSIAGSHDDGSGLLASMLVIRCNLLRELGAFDLALRAVESARSALAQGAASYLPMVDIALAQVWLQLGQNGRAQQALPKEEALSGLPSWAAARRWLVLARCRAASRQPVGDALARAVALTADGGLRVVCDTVALHAAAVGATLDDLDTLQALGAQARRDGRDGVALTAACFGAQLAGTVGLRQLALQQAGEARALLGHDAGSETAVAPADIGEPEAWLCVARAYDAAGQPAEAASAREHGRARLAQIEREHVAPELRDSFRLRNPAHWALLSAPRAAEPDPGR
jgi:DNA-binding SARP family transcriptional activator/tetratricopeptide (TPR) repeat protein